MRHLFVTNDFPPKVGGIESYLTNLCSGFFASDVVVVAPAREGWRKVDEQLPYEVIRLPGSYLRATRRVFKGIAEAAERFEIDAIHFLAALPMGRLGPRLRQSTGLPFTVIAHGTGEILLPSRVPFARRALRKVLIEADIVLPVSEFTRDAVDHITEGRANVVVVPPSIDVTRFSLDVSGGDVRARYGLGAEFVVLFVSRLVKRKGADTLIRALAEADAIAVIVGTGSERASLERLAREAGVADRVVFAGFVPDGSLPTFYAAADCFCMPCSTRLRGLDTEGFGVVYLEAQASGLACIAGRCGGSVEAVVQGETGAVLEDSTPDAVAAAIEVLRNDPALCARLGAAGRLRAEREFAPEVAAGRIEESLEEVIG
ncbi:MAG: glycosyltransferase family 4 protein [Actinomycetota bacterium]